MTHWSENYRAPWWLNQYEMGRKCIFQCFSVPPRNFVFIQNFFLALSCKETCILSQFFFFFFLRSPEKILFPLIKPFAFCVMRALVFAQHHLSGLNHCPAASENLNAEYCLYELTDRRTQKFCKRKNTKKKMWENARIFVSDHKSIQTYIFFTYGLCIKLKKKK